MCFGSTLVTRSKNFSTRAHPARTYPHSSVGSCTCPANVGTRNPRGLTRPAQDSILQSGRLKLYGKSNTIIYNGGYVNFTKICPCFGFVNVKKC